MRRQFANVFLDISGVCNAKCPYCISGRHKAPGGGFIAAELFEQVLQRLITQQLIGNDSLLGLYNWGEPFLHPRLGELLKIANGSGVSYAFSTNASLTPHIDRTFVKGLKMIIFSMPGFSQSSYDRIHRFAFPSICTNIETIVDRARSAGYRGGFRIHYHVYQFNISEIPLCEQFSRRLGIDLVLHYAILNHWDHLWAYVDNTLPYPRLKEVSQDLLCFPFRDLRPGSVESYRCPQYDLLAIDESANVLLCCQVPRGHQYSAGNLLNDDIDTILRRREHSDLCTRCISRGMAQYINRSLTFPVFWKPHGGLPQRVLGRLCRKIREYVD